MRFLCGVRVYNPSQGVFVMIVRGDPTYPSVRALLGDYAIRQNEGDRSQLLLNHVMDTTFRPLHLAWKKLWHAQLEAEKVLEEARSERDEAAKSLHAVLRHVHRVLHFRDGGDGLLIGRYLPGGTLDCLYLPATRLLRELERHPAQISDAPDGEIPASLKRSFAEKLAHLGEAQARVDQASERALKAHRERAESDDEWSDAFHVFHRAVEYVAFKGRGVVKDWVRDWVVAAAGPIVPPEAFAVSESFPPREPGALSEHPAQLRHQAY